MDRSIITLDWSVIVGSGFVLAVLLLALIERLRHTFATKEELNGFGTRVNVMEARYDQWHELVEEARESVRALEAEQRHQADRLNRQVIDPLQRITGKLEELAAGQIAQAAAVKHVERWLDSLATRFERDQLHPGSERNAE